MFRFASCNWKVTVLLSSHTQIAQAASRSWKLLARITRRTREHVPTAWILSSEDEKAQPIQSVPSIYLNRPWAAPINPRGFQDLSERFFNRKGIRCLRKKCFPVGSLKTRCSLLLAIRHDCGWLFCKEGFCHDLDGNVQYRTHLDNVTKTLPSFHMSEKAERTFQTFKSTHNGAPSKCAR